MRLAMLYSKGNGVPQDRVQAVGRNVSKIPIQNPQSPPLSKRRFPVTHVLDSNPDGG